MTLIQTKLSTRTVPVHVGPRFLTVDDLFYTDSSQAQARTLYPDWPGWGFSQASSAKWCRCTCGCEILVGFIVKNHELEFTDGQLFCERCGRLVDYY